MKGRSYHETFKTLCLSLLLKYFNHHPRACPRERLIRALPFKPGAASPDCQHSVRMHLFYSAHDFGRRSFKLYRADSGCYGDRIRHSGAEEKAACYWQDSVDSVMASMGKAGASPQSSSAWTASGPVRPTIRGTRRLPLRENNFIYHEKYYHRHSAI